MLYTEKLANEFKEKMNDLVLKIDEDKDWTFDVIATTQDRDRDNEEIKINARDTKNREKNPVVLANHHYTIESIIGKGLKFYTSNGVKRLKGVFSKVNPLGILAKELYNEGMLKSVSVGFIPTKRNDEDYKIIEKAELLEVSFVAVPCNPNAISMDQKLFEEAVSKGLLIKDCPCDDQEEKEDLEEITLEKVYGELQEVKSLLKTFADDKAEKDEIENDIEQAKAQKALLQEINKASATALQKIKLL